MSAPTNTDSLWYESGALDTYQGSVLVGQSLTVNGTVVFSSMTLSSETITGSPLELIAPSTKLLFVNTVAAGGNMQSASWRMSTNGPNTNRFILRDETISKDLIVIGSSGTTGIGDIVGTATNDNAASGMTGEYISQYTASVPLASGQYISISTISLTAGDWDVSVNGIFAPHGGPTVSGPNNIWISNTPNSSDSDSAGDQGCYFFTSGSFSTGCSVPAVRISLASSANYYCVMNASFTGGAPTGFCRISARRVR